MEKNRTEGSNPSPSAISEKSCERRAFTTNWPVDVPVLDTNRIAHPTTGP
jgi:hypothetical protein